jgi:3-isopropylmalate dehydrogenase
MALRYSFDMGEAADLVEKAVTGVLDQGLRTGDIMQDNRRKVGTREMGAAIVKELDRLAA